MSNLIKVNYDSERPTVLGRELHESLGISTAYKDWFPRMCEYGFIEGQDFNPLIFERVQMEGERAVSRQVADHQLTIDMAKEICMIQRSSQGKQVRQYFIELEKQWNAPESVMARALKMADIQLGQLRLENEQQRQIIGELKPSADYADRILQNKGLVTITQIAKDYGMSGSAMNRMLATFEVQYKQSGQWLLYRKYHNKGYTHSETIDITRSDGRPDIVMETKWTQKGRLFIYELLKREGILPIIEKQQIVNL